MCVVVCFTMYLQSSPSHVLCVLHCLLALTSKGPAIEVTEKMVESVTFLVWTAEANSIKRTLEPSEVHDAVCKVASSTRAVILLT